MLAALYPIAHPKYNCRARKCSFGRRPTASWADPRPTLQPLWKAVNGRASGADLQS